MAEIIFGVFGLAAVVLLGVLFRNWHNQREFEASDHVVPEDYD